MGRLSKYKRLLCSDNVPLKGNAKNMKKVSENCFNPFFFDVFRKRKTFYLNEGTGYISTIWRINCWREIIRLLIHRRVCSSAQRNFFVDLHGKTILITWDLGIQKWPRSVGSFWNSKIEARAVFKLNEICGGTFNKPNIQIKRVSNYGNASRTWFSSNDGIFIWSSHTMGFQIEEIEKEIKHFSILLIKYKSNRLEAWNIIFSTHLNAYKFFSLISYKSS